MAEQRKISLVLSDVDGTLVTEEKVLTEDARAAVRRLLDAGIRFAVTSGRPPLGMAMLLDALHLDTPIAGFNGGLFVTPDLAILEQKTLPEDVAAKSIELIRAHGLDAWVYRGNDWLISRADAPHVAREAWTVKFDPKVVADVAEKLDQVAKIVGVSDDLERVQRCEADAEVSLGPRATARRVATLLPRYHAQRCEQGCSGGILFASPEDSGGRDRHHRRPAERCAHVQAIGLQLSPWGTPPTKSRRRPASARIPTTMKASPRRWNASS
jgi:hypothetical protein